MFWRLISWIFNELPERESMPQVHERLSSKTGVAQAALRAVRNIWQCAPWWQTMNNHNCKYQQWISWVDCSSVQKYPDIQCPDAKHFIHMMLKFHIYMMLHILQIWYYDTLATFGWCRNVCRMHLPSICHLLSVTITQTEETQSRQ